MRSRLGLRRAHLRLTVVATMISVAVILPMLGAVSPAASVRATSGTSAQLASAPPAVSSKVVVVTTTADVVNGAVSSVSALNANPGADGISLREALTAADATGGSATVYIMFSAALNGATIEPATPLPPIHRDHFVLEGIAPNGSPATVTLDGRRVTAAQSNQAIVLARASDVTVRWLRFTGVTPYSDPGSQEFAVRVAPGPFVYLNDTPHGPQQIVNVQIVDNVFDNSEVPSYTGHAGTNAVTVFGDPAGVSMRISGITIVRNTFLHFGEGNGEAVGVWATAPGEQVQGVVIKDNRMDQDMLGIELGLGTGAPRLAGTQIVGNTITGSEIAVTLNTTAPNQTTSDGTIDGTLIEGNVISGVQGPAMDLGVAPNTQIVNNVVYADLATLAGIYMGAGGATTSPVTIENDTFVNEQQGSLFVTVASQSGASGNNAIVRNSIFYSPTAPSPIYVGGPGGSTAPDVLTNSLISGPGWAGTHGNISGNPQFFDEAAGDFHLTAASPAINAGTTIGAPLDDFDGAWRDAQPDIGASEFGAAPRPLLTVRAVQLAGTGTVTSSPAGIACDTGCGARFDRNTMVTLSATPGAGSAFAGWSGGGCSGTGSCTVMMSSDQTVTAIFVPTIHTLTVSRAGGGSGSVAGTAISCPGACSARYASGTLVTLIATPASGSVFGGWSGGGCRGTGSCAVTISSDQTVTATFTPVPSITAFRLTHTRFRVGPHATALTARASAAARRPKVPQGSKFLYTLSRASTATIVIERQTSGHVIGKKCVAQTKANAKKKRCTISRRVGTLTRRSKAGRNTIAFSGRIGRKALAAASYRATITARAGAGPTSKPRSATFTIVRS